MSEPSADFTSDQLIRFARTVVDAVPSPSAVLDRDLRIAAANRAFEGLSGETSLTGRNLAEIAGGLWNRPELSSALAQVLPASKAFDDIPAAGPDRQKVFVSARKLATMEGRADLIFVGFDNSAVQDRTQEGFRNEGVFREIVNTVREPMLALSFDHRVQLANSAFFRYFRLSADDVIGRPLSEIGQGEWDVAELRDALTAINSDDSSFDDFEIEREFPEIGRRIVLLNGRRIDHLHLVLLAFQDVTERRDHRSLQEARITEMAHSIKNLFAVIQSLAYQTEAPTLDLYKTSLLGRIKALAMSHGVLFEGHGTEANLQQLLTNLLLPHLHAIEDRIVLDGPAVTIAPSQASPLALVIHELATNAVKYGALSENGGRLLVSWHTDSEGLHLTWSEVEGPPLHGEPGNGLGSVLVQQLIERQLGGKLERNFKPEGFRCRLDIPFAER